MASHYLYSACGDSFSKFTPFGNKVVVYVYEGDKTSEVAMSVKAARSYYRGLLEDNYTKQPRPDSKVKLRVYADKQGITLEEAVKRIQATKQAPTATRVSNSLHESRSMPTSLELVSAPCGAREIQEATAEEQFRAMRKYRGWEQN